MAITGTSGDDPLRGTNQADDIRGLGGNDVIAGLDGNDLIHGDGGSGATAGPAEVEVAGSFVNVVGRDLPAHVDPNAPVFQSGYGGLNGQLGIFFEDGQPRTGGLAVSAGFGVVLGRLTTSEGDDRPIPGGESVANFGGGEGLLNGRPEAAGDRKLDLSVQVIVGGETRTAVFHIDPVVTPGFLNDNQNPAALVPDNTLPDDTATEDFRIPDLPSQVVDFANGARVEIDPAALIFTDNGQRQELHATVTLLQAPTAADGDDVLAAGPGDDRVFGDGGNDNLAGDAGDDVLDGGDGNDHLDGGQGNDILSGGFDFNTLSGGAGTDTADYTFFGGRTNVNLASGRADFPDANPLGLIETLSGIENVRTGAGDDTIIGDHRSNLLEGGAGNDRLFGNDGNDRLIGGSGYDVLRGGDGRDVLRGGAGADHLVGGLGADRFVFDDGDTGLGPHRDKIADFTFAAGDRIDLRPIDANALVDGDQAFVLIGSATFTAPGQLRFYVGGSDRFVQGNTDGDSAPEFVIELDDVGANPIGTWFLL